MKANSKQDRIYQQLIQKIKTGSYKSDDKIPATRELAKLYRCHRFTVMQAMQSLVAEGWLVAVAKSHYKVSEKIPITQSSKSLSLQKKDLNLKIIRKAPNADLEREKYPLEFWGGQPDLKSFPKDEFRKILSDSLRYAKAESLNYGYTEGLDFSLKQISDYLRKSRNLVGKDFILTHGSQEALLLIAQLFIKPGDAIAVEQKGYPPAWRLFENLGAKLIPIRVDEEGLDTDHLRAVLKKQKIKMIYVTPLHQYPTTVTLSPRRRQNLIQIAENFEIPILEDDYDHEFHYTQTPPSPISTETECGIYVCSFSKVLFPGARLGAVACSSKIKEHLTYQKYLVSRQTDCLSQLGLAYWIKEGGFDRHLRKMRRIYEQRYLFMIEKLKQIQTTKEISWISPNGGMSIWVNLHQDSLRIQNEAKKQGVFFQYENSMDYLQKKGTHLRIGFAGVNEQQITTGLTILNKLL